VLRLSYNVDFGYISLFEVIGIVAAYAATIPITSYNDTYMYIYIYRVSQEECATLREGVP